MVELIRVNEHSSQELADEQSLSGQALHELEFIALSTLDALTVHLAILDQSGRIVMVNRAWRVFAQANGGMEQQVSEGVNYLTVCDSAHGAGSAGAKAFADGIRAVMAEEIETYSAEYPCDSPAESRWFMGIVTRFFTAEGIRVVVTHENITERKKTEQALRQSEAQYRVLFEDNPHPMWVYDLNTLAFLAVNDEAVRHYGYSRSEFLSMTLKDIRPAEDVPALLEDINRARSGQSNRGIWQHRKKDGALIDVEIAAHTLSVPDERAQLILSLDVTERRRTEAELREAQERMTGIISSAMDAIITVNAEQRVVLFNAAAEQMFGCTASEAVGQSLDRFIPERFRAAHREHIPAFARTHVTRRRMGELGAIFGVRADGEEFPIEASISQVEAGGQRLYTVILRDISARKRAEEELRRSEERYRRLFETAPDIIYTLSASGVISSINPACETVTGWQAAALLGQRFTVLIHPDDVKTGEAIFQQVMQGETPPPYELRIPTNSGQWLVAEFVSSPQFENGRVMGLLGIARDITGRKQAEEQIRLWSEQLEQRVAQRTAELEAANRELEAFTYSVSHDLRAPLRAVAGFSRILREEYEPQLPAEAQRYLHRVQENAQQMGRLIDDLLAFSRLGRQPLKRQPVAPAEVVQSVLDELREEQAGRQVQINIGELPTCQADPALLKQVFANLLANALKFTRHCEVAVIEIGGRHQYAEENASVFFVKDNGAGFDMKYVHKLFGVFQRLHRAEEYEGTGVGLATVQRIIHRHGGRIWAESQLDQGATFYFTLGRETND